MKESPFMNPDFNNAAFANLPKPLASSAIDSQPSKLLKVSFRSDGNYQHVVRDVRDGSPE